MTTTEQAVQTYDEADLQQKAKDHLWMHFSRQSVLEKSGAPIIVKVFQCPCGTAPSTRCPRGARPRVRVIAVLTPLSSTNTSFETSTPRTFLFQ